MKCFVTVTQCNTQFSASISASWNKHVHFEKHVTSVYILGDIP